MKKIMKMLIAGAAILGIFFLNECSAMEIEQLTRGGKKASGNIDTNNQRTKQQLLEAAKMPNYNNLAKLLTENNNINVDANCYEEGRSLLHIAAIGNNTDLATILVSRKANIEAKDKNGSTPLHLAVMAGSSDMIKLLIDKKADIEALDKECNTLLHYAAKCTNNAEDTWKLIIQYYEDNIDISNKKGHTALHIAALQGNLGMIYRLVNNNANINAKDTEGITPVSCAISSNCPQNTTTYIVSYLMIKGADFTVKNHKGATLLHNAAKTGKKDIVNFLTTKIPVDARDIYGCTALHYAAFYDREDIGKLLIDNKADVDAKNSTGETPLHLAVLKNNLNMTNLLIQKANINAVDIKNKTPLHFAIERGNLEVAKILIDNHADINAKDLYGRTLLHYAANQNNQMLARELIVDNANMINKKDLYGRTPLFFAVNNNNKVAVILFINKGANISGISDNYGLNILHIVAARTSTYISNLFKSNYGCESIQPGNWNDDSLEIAKLVIDETADINAWDNNGRTAMYYATEANNIDMIKLIANRICKIRASKKVEESEYHNDLKKPLGRKKKYS